MKEFDKKDIIDQDLDFSKYISELVEQLRNDKDVYDSLKPFNFSVKEVKDNIAKLTEYKDDFNYCKNCPGINKCAKNNPLTSIRIIKEGNYVNLQMSPCKKMVDKMKIDSNYICSDFPEEWKSYSLNNLDLNTNNRRLIIKNFKDILNNKGHWMYLKGSKRVGKSFILAILANQFISLGYGKVAVASFPKLVSSLADLSYKFKNDFNNQMSILENAPLLILDDFGDEYKNEYIRDTIVIPLLNERVSKNLPTFFASEFSIKDVCSMYNVGKVSGSIRAKQLQNILNSMCEKEIDLGETAIY